MMFISNEVLLQIFFSIHMNNMNIIKLKLLWNLKSLQGSHGHPTRLCHWVQDFRTKVGDYGQSYYYAHVDFGTTM